MKKFAAFLAAAVFLGAAYPIFAEEDANKNILKQGILGAGVGAVSASASGGKAGKGALIGAGTNVIGGALLDTLFSSPKPAQPVYAQQPQYVEQPVQYVQAAPQQYQQPQVQYVQQPAYYPVAPQEDPNKKIIKNGLLGAGVGAISASASGGKAGKGALIGAGTNVIGGALLDTLTAPSSVPQPQPVYVQQVPTPPVQYQPAPATSTHTSSLKKKILRKYDKDGRVVSEEEVWE